MKEQMNLDNLLVNKRMSDAGKIERYCCQNLFQYMTLKSDKYDYEFTPSSENIKIAYDGILTIRYKMTGTIVGYHLVEAKQRSNTDDYDTLIYEQSKHKALLKCKNERDKFYKSQFSDKWSHGILYVCITENGSYLYDIHYLYENKLLPNLTERECNKITVAQNGEKINKKIYLLPKKDAVKYNWSFDAKIYVEQLNKNKVELDNHITNVKKTYSIF